MRIVYVYLFESSCIRACRSDWVSKEQETVLLREATRNARLDGTGGVVKPAFLPAWNGCCSKLMSESRASRNGLNERVF